MPGNTTGNGREAAIRDHLLTIGETPALSSADEVAIAAAVADGREAENDLAALTTKAVPALDDVATLRARIRAGDEAHETLIASCRRLVVGLARRHPADGPKMIALLAAGDEALGRAADRYDPTGGLSFSAFARWWIERAMREVEADPIGDDLRGHELGRRGADPADPTLLTALGHLHRDDCRVIELRLGLSGGPALSTADTARVLGVDITDTAEREERALAKLRHPCTPGDLTRLQHLDS